ncbi:MAG: hypothetical protein KBF42_02110 [Chitinophagales bacterium]|nr:hypothetical protein [Bacteroidota bacterium]MBK7569883.1 hypothetical protein [Bacteroidota bacterium]MBP8915494.1 hypothetical protein [Chitinophagales bacterium]MBP9220149.1 hypothetical protein [Chitinophagales bacterium]MBP9795479.1 hypothetical protein [Chitinophagales bacterium]
MKQFMFFALLINFLSSCTDQNSVTEHKKEFEGKIIYLTKLESKSTKFTTDEFQSFFGDTMTLYIKNGNYRMSYSGKDVKDIYYINKDNNQYTLRHGIDTLYVGDCSMEEKHLKSTKIKENAEFILQRQCDLLINETEDWKTFYWFDPSLYINPDNFTNHEFGHVNTYYSKARSPWLKYKYEGRSYNLSHQAIYISEEKINDDTFELPKLPRGILK